MGSIFLLWSGPHSRSVPRDPLKPKAVSESQRQFRLGRPEWFFHGPQTHQSYPSFLGTSLGPWSLRDPRRGFVLSSSVALVHVEAWHPSWHVPVMSIVHAGTICIYVYIYIYTAQWNVMEHRLLWDAIVTSRDCVQGWCQLSEPRHTEWVTCKSRTSRHYWP